MSDCSLSPKRKASQIIGSPNKRVTLDVNSDIKSRTLSILPSDNISVRISRERAIKDTARQTHSSWRECKRYTVDAEYYSSDPKDPAITINSDGPLMLYDCQWKDLKPLASKNYIDPLERRVSSVIIQGDAGDQKKSGTLPLDISDGAETEEFGYLLSSRKYVELHVSIRVTRCKRWAKVIDVSCIYGGIEVASASGHLIYRELIRDDFYDSMESLGKPVSDRIDELLDHHGYFRWSIKEYYLGKQSGRWNDALDTGSILQIDEVLVNKEWESQALGALMVTSLIDRAVKHDCGAKFALVLPSTGCFWKVEDTGIKAFDKSQSWAEQNHVCFFLGAGFIRVAGTGWFVLDIIGEDEVPGVELQEGESKSSKHKILVSGITNK